MANQSSLRFTFEPESGIAFDVIEFTLEEGLSSLFRLELKLCSSDPNIDFAKILDKPALFNLYYHNQLQRQVHGLVSLFSQQQIGFRRTHYRAVIEPQLARLQLCSDWRVFQALPVGEIIRTIFKQHNLLHYELNLTHSHLPREYCVQAGDCDEHFIARLAAEEGLVYRFDHSATRHQLILADQIQYLAPLCESPILYQSSPGADQPQPCLWQFSYQQQVRTSHQTQRDYSFKNPQYSQQHESIGAHGPRYEHYDYPGRYKGDAAGKPFTKTRLHSRRNDHLQALVSGDDARLQPGVAFDLIGHPRAELNRRWRVVTMCHYGYQHTSLEEDNALSQQDKGTHYHFDATLIHSENNWQAPILDKPRIDGPQMAHVTGPEGEEIFCDEWGRVKIQFPWDRQAKYDEHSSCWVRVAQSWAGRTWGQIAIPRIGQEVMVDFLDGDPDQPIITGRTYHVVNQPPYPLPGLKTLQTVKSREHKGRGYNELLIDDTHGELKTQLHSTHAASQLTLGYLTHPRKRDGSGQHRGDGFELRTDDWGAIRAAKGLYLSADKRTNAEGNQLDLQEAITQLQNALTLATDLANAAAKVGAVAADTENQQYQLEQVYNDMQQAGLLVSAPHGVAMLTPRSIQLSASQNLTFTAQKHTDISTTNDFRLVAGDKISLLSVNQDTSVIANKGKMTIQAQHNTMTLNAHNDLTLTSSKGKTVIAAKEELLLTCGGAYIKLQDGKVEIGGTAALDVKMAGMNLCGPSELNHPLPSFKQSSIKQNIVTLTEEKSIMNLNNTGHNQANHSLSPITKNTTEQNALKKTVETKQPKNKLSAFYIFSE